MARKVLVTGASGFAGGYLTRELVEAGCDVRILARRSSSLDGLKGLNIEIVCGDLADDELPPQLMRGAEIVYNIAAMYRHEGDRNAFFAVNLHGVKRLLKAAYQAGVKRFVHCSTVGVMGNIAHPPADENTAYGPGDWYQRSKLEGEKAVLEFGQKYNFPVCVIRPSAIYGPGDMRFLKLFRAINNGTFVCFGSGDIFYHYVYVQDLVQGFMLAADSDEAVGEVFIIAGEQYITINELVRLIAQTLGRPVPRLHLPIAPVMLAARACSAACQPLHIEPPLYPRRLDFFRKHRAFDITKAKRMLGYKPAFDLPTGLANTAAWYRQAHYL